MTMQWRKGLSMRSTRFGRKTLLSSMTWWWLMPLSGPALLSSGSQMSAGIYIVFILLLIKQGLNPSSNVNMCLSSDFLWPVSTTSRCIPVLSCVLEMYCYFSSHMQPSTNCKTVLTNSGSALLANYVYTYKSMFFFITVSVPAHSLYRNGIQIKQGQQNWKGELAGEPHTRERERAQNQGWVLQHEQIQVYDHLKC